MIPLDSHLNQDLHMNINIHQSVHILCCYDSTYVELDQIKFQSVGLYRYIYQKNVLKQEARRNDTSGIWTQAN